MCVYVCGVHARACIYVWVCKPLSSINLLFRKCALDCTVEKFVLCQAQIFYLCIHSCFWPTLHVCKWKVHSGGCETACLAES